MTSWQPIETAPKDGRDILVWQPSGLFEGRRGVIRTANWATANGLGAFRVNAHSFVRLDPTRWMPLPDPPE